MEKIVPTKSEAEQMLFEKYKPFLKSECRSHRIEREFKKDLEKLKLKE